MQTRITQRSSLWKDGNTAMNKSLWSLAWIQNAITLKRMEKAWKKISTGVQFHHLTTTHFLKFVILIGLYSLDVEPSPESKHCRSGQRSWQDDDRWHLWTLCSDTERWNFFRFEEKIWRLKVYRWNRKPHSGTQISINNSRRWTYHMNNIADLYRCPSEDIQLYFQKILQ